MTETLKLFAACTAGLMILDGIWLGVVMKPDYDAFARELGRLGRR